MLIVDGHNLIPKIPGLSLAEMDDETALIERLQVFARARRVKVTVFFDGAPPGHDGLQTYGAVSAIFVRQGRTADDAIRNYLTMMKQAARGARVVSSDRMVKANARERGAGVVTSDVFARELEAVIAAQGLPPARAAARQEPPQPEPSPKDQKAVSELEEWYSLFGIDAQQAEQPIEPPEGQRRRRRPQVEPNPAPSHDGQGKGKAAGKKRRFHGFPSK